MSEPLDPSDQPDSIEDWAGLGDLVELTVDRVSGVVEGMHQAIAGRWIGLMTAADSPARSLSRSAIGGIYGTVRIAGSIVGGAIGLGARQAAKAAPLRRLWGPGAGSSIQATVNAVWGDELEERGSRLSLDMGLRSVAGAPIHVDRDALSQGFPDATARLVVLVHGWSESERIWDKLPDDGGSASLRSRLAAGDRTPLLVRYNSGRHVSTNGAQLAALLESVIESWPVAVQQIDLVGHSMGGLVARSAALLGAESGHHWRRLAGHIVTLGTPHLGSPIEKGLAAISQALRITPESRPVGDFLDLRSSGVKDLRFGAVMESDWLDTHPDRLIDTTSATAEEPEDISQHFATGVVTRDPDNPVGIILGDLVVRTASGTGRGARRQVAATNVRVFGGRRHPDLLRDANVHAQVVDWLSGTD